MCLLYTHTHKHKHTHILFLKKILRDSLTIFGSLDSAMVWMWLIPQRCMDGSIKSWSLMESPRSSGNCSQNGILVFWNEFSWEQVVTKAWDWYLNLSGFVFGDLISLLLCAPSIPICHEVTQQREEVLERACPMLFGLSASKTVS
jgi:hypothetical protein